METSQETINLRNGSVSDESIVEETEMGRWIYLYLKTEERMANHTENDAQLVDRMTREPIDFIEMDDFLFFILLAYSSISETGRHRASIGKRIMGIEVVDERGATMTWRRALGRNIGKFLFAFLFVVGFMMASWTDL